MYLNDKTNNRTVIRLHKSIKKMTYLNWVKENHPSLELALEEYAELENSSSLQKLEYFGFNTDSLIDSIFSLLPLKMANQDSNKKLLSQLLTYPERSKSHCCEQAGKSPTHYYRFVKTIRDICDNISSVTGGRNPVLIIENIRSDF